MLPLLLLAQQLGEWFHKLFQSLPPIFEHLGLDLALRKHFVRPHRVASLHDNSTLSLKPPKNHATKQLHLAIVVEAVELFDTNSTELAIGHLSGCWRVVGYNMLAEKRLLIPQLGRTRLFAGRLAKEQFGFSKRLVNK